MKKWKILDSSIVLGEKWFEVRKDKVKLPKGTVLDDYFIWNSPDVAMVVPVTSNGNFIFVKQYKHGAGEIMIECPAGYVDEGEKSLDAAKREVLEETGYKLKNIQLLAKTIHHPTKENGIMHVFLADIAGKTSNVTNPNESEEIEVLELSPKRVLKMIREGEIWADGTITATFLAFDKLGLLQFGEK